MSPPAVTDLLRELLPIGIEVDGSTVSGIFVVGTSTWLLHHNESVFFDPRVFCPERLADR